MKFFDKLIDKRLAAYQRELIEIHYAEVENMYRQIRGWRHDYRSHIQAMKAHAAENDWAAVRAYLDTLETDLATVDTVVKTGNPMADAILNSKISLARSKGIPVRAEASVPVLEQAVDEAVALANEIAPEHLEVVTADPEAILPQIRNAGAVFLGSWSPEPLGDYLAGPDHVLPTSSTARFFSPLSVTSFIKTMSVIAYDKATLEPVKDEIIALARSEKLTAHANSIQVRFE